MPRVFYNSCTEWELIFYLILCVQAAENTFVEGSDVSYMDATVGSYPMPLTNSART